MATRDDGPSNSSVPSPVFEWEEYDKGEIVIQVNDYNPNPNPTGRAMYPMTLEHQGLEFCRLLTVLKSDDVAIITKLYIQVCYFSSEGWDVLSDVNWKDLCEAIGSKIKYLRSLTIQISKAAAISSSRLRQLLEHLPLLERLTFEGSFSKTDDFEATLQQLPSLLPRLTHLSIEDDSNSPDGFSMVRPHFTTPQCKGLAKAISDMKCLTQFTTCNAKFDNEFDARLLAEALCRSTTLKYAKLNASSLFTPALYCNELNAQLEYITTLNKAGRGRIDPSLEDLVESIVHVRQRTDCIYYFLSEHPHVYAFAALSSRTRRPE